MANEGRRIRARRERLNALEGVRLRQADLAQLAKISRQTLIGIEAGKGFNHITGERIHQALDALEAEHGVTEPVDIDADEIVEFEVRAPGIDATVIVRGPIRDRVELEESVIRLLRGMSPERDS